MARYPDDYLGTLLHPRNEHLLRAEVGHILESLTGRYAREMEYTLPKEPVSVEAHLRQLPTQAGWSSLVYFLFLGLLLDPDCLAVAMHHMDPRALGYLLRFARGEITAYQQGRSIHNLPLAPGQDVAYPTVEFLAHALLFEYVTNGDSFGAWRKFEAPPTRPEPYNGRDARHRALIAAAAAASTPR